MKYVIDIDKETKDMVDRLVVEGKTYLLPVKVSQRIEKALKVATPLNKELDKISTEIEAIEEGITSYYNDRPWIFKDEVLEIIDKYKAESEDKE